MINIIIPVIDDVEKFSAFVEKKLKKDVRFFVGICESKMKSWTLRQTKRKLSTHFILANLLRGKFLVQEEH